uniref:zinc metalloproteinase nas-15-like n=1 Tax=Ciona intestinalis TaxID=7719 RepID=UPI000EF4A5B9|nr:zinc metalloproteinase nas-15-like [Ciona intestinalis]|eukprot:XP_026694513.1 zinc metalloproteinase nas-15-like [Ciona intestinalis]
MKKATTIFLFIQILTNIWTVSGLRNFILNQLTIQCRPDCRDRFSFCPSAILRCNTNNLWKASCPQTCGVCFRCGDLAFQADGSTVPISTCEPSTNRCSPAARVMCRKSCRICTPCTLPPTKPPCTNTCTDHYTSCEYWSNLGYCDVNGEYPHVRHVCGKMCGLCERCPQTTTAIASTIQNPPQGLLPAEVTPTTTAPINTTAITSTTTTYQYPENQDQSNEDSYRYDSHGNPVHSWWPTQN